MIEAPSGSVPTSRAASPASLAAGSTGRLWLVLILLAVAASAVVAARSMDRNYFGWGTETDYLGTYVPEARRVLQGDNLEMRYHPPVYPVVLSLAFRATGDWLNAGLLLSGLGFLLALLASGAAMTWLAGKAAGVGAVLGLSISAIGLSYASLATSDIPYLAAYMFAVALAFGAWMRSNGLEGRGTVWTWFLAGVSLAMALGMRANSLTLLALLALPLLRRRRRDLLAMLAGLVLVTGGWWGYGAVTGTPTTPTHTYMNLALTYFTPSDDRQSGDSWRDRDPTEMFDSVVDVVRHDPAAIVTTYLRDLVDLPRTVLRSGLFPLPAFVLTVPGLILLFRRFRHPLVGVFFVVTASQVLLTNFKTFEARYYLFLVPVFGAAAGCAVAWVWGKAERFASGRVALLRLALVPVLILFVAALGYRSLAQSRSPLHSADAELSSCLDDVVDLVPAGAPLMSRKPHVPHYADAVYIGLPPVDELTQLHEVLRDGFNGEPMWCGLREPAVLDLDPEDAIYIYFGRNEAKLRGDLAALLDPKTAPGWLDPVESGSSNDAPWALYRFTPATAVPSGTP